ncbi:hypothetical protein GGS23DRAFT_589696 [Durotheca rogersii]|uniref:uncharacterized protein n=1 Tax=Durotheca rogersii TaxID=419775 RepID=UPI00221ECA35|nr:uncharacterized protein GGS23DRAFT_589696 [Durotheca rogersii]KAI5855561.1 hypothetical protein GGS23DRAFT_589696 [Durotheca rogersii]
MFLASGWWNGMVLSLLSCWVSAAHLVLSGPGARRETEIETHDLCAMPGVLSPLLSPPLLFPSLCLLRTFPSVSGEIRETVRPGYQTLPRCNERHLWGAGFLPPRISLLSSLLYFISILIIKKKFSCSFLRVHCSACSFLPSRDFVLPPTQASRYHLETGIRRR